jgi:anti-sigma factor RsiW
MTSHRTTAHCSDEELNDWIDGRLDASTGERVRRHCAACGECTAQADALRAVVAAARSAPDAILPPDVDAMERAIVARLAASAPAVVDAPARVLALHATSAAPARARPARRRTALLIAAGLALMAASSLVTARLVRQDAAPAIARAPEPRPSTPVQSAVVRPAVSATEVAELREETDVTLSALRAAVAGGDRVLAAETLRVLERSLATIDAAIVEAESALARDPGNAALAELIARTYERKRELVRRGAVLGSRS